MKTYLNLSYIFKVMAAALFCLFVPFWFAPFVLSLSQAFFSDVKSSAQLVIHAIVYFIISTSFYIYCYFTGSRELVFMIGNIFQGVSFPVLAGLSALIYTLSACLGAWTGIQFKRTPQKSV